MHRCAGAGMEEGSPPATRRVTEDRNKTQETTADAIQLIEDFLTSSNPTEYVNNAWEWVKNALVEARAPRVDQGKQDASGSNSQAQDIAEIKAGLGELSRTVQGLAKQLGPDRPATYSQILHQAYNTTARAARTAGAARTARATAFLTSGNSERIKRVPLVYNRQLIINLKNESKS